MNFEFTKPSHDTKKITDFSADIDILHTALGYAELKKVGDNRIFKKD